jgi:hypothetical protein
MILKDVNQNSNLELQYLRLRIRIKSQLDVEKTILCLNTHKLSKIQHTVRKKLKKKKK